MKWWNKETRWRRAALILFLLSLLLWGWTLAAGDESGFSLMIGSGVLVLITHRKLLLRSKKGSKPEEQP